ncbi:MAG: sulfotransferase [Gammaproteobacteria bacterium]|nr:sulfotransferase [Gammaproteobacteria bacterium]
MKDFLYKVKKTAKYYEALSVVAIRKARFAIAPVSLAQPIFVIGCSRAGTTLVYKTFSESNELGSLQKETHDFWASLHPVAKRNWSSHEIPKTFACEEDAQQATRLFYTGTGRRRIVDKNNQNGLSVPYLYGLFPDAHFVFIKRNPGDNIESLIKGWGKNDEFGAWAADLPFSVGIDMGAYRQWCFFLAEGWRNYCQSSIEQVCAFQYESINRAILCARENIPVKQWHEVGYEDLLANPVNEFRCLFESCGLDFDSALERHCATVLDKPYNTFSDIGVDKWRKGVNRERVENALENLDDITVDLGY